MQARQAPPAETLTPYTFATWVFTLHVAGVRASDPKVAEACEAVLHATEAKGGTAAGEQRVASVQGLLADGDVRQSAARLYGDRVGGDLGDGDRYSRTSRIRRYQFAAQLPRLQRPGVEHAPDAERGQHPPGHQPVEGAESQVDAAEKDQPPEHHLEGRQRCKGLRHPPEATAAFREREGQ